jgi:hypothetical protein
MVRLINFFKTFHLKINLFLAGYLLKSVARKRPPQAPSPAPAPVKLVETVEEPATVIEDPQQPPAFFTGFYCMV